MRTVHYVVSGHVQGVFFRYHTQEKARALGIRGTVRNLHDGDVEIYAQGEGADLARFEAFLRHGPAAARVDAVRRREIESSETYRGFEILR